MRLIASRPQLTIAAAAIVALFVALQWAFGFRVSESAGRTLELAAAFAYGGVAILLLAPLGRARALMAAGLAFILVAWSVHLNTRYAVGLASGVGGLAPTDHARVVIATLLVGPFAGLLTAIATFVLARREMIRWSGKPYAS